MRLHVASVCKTLPNPDSSAAGAFVMRRLEAMAELADLEIIQPLPYFPVLRPLPSWGRSPSHVVGRQAVQHAPMFYVPGVMKRWDGAFLARAVSRSLAAAAGRRRLDLVDAHFGYPDGVGAVRAAARLGVPAFVTIRGLETDYLEDPVIGPQLLQALQASAGCISVSHSLKDLVTGHGLSADHVEVIPNAVDRTRFRPRDRQAARARLGLSADRPLIVSVGTMIELKRHHIVVSALAGVRERHPGATLAIIGMERDEPGYVAKLERTAADAGVSQAVRVVGAVAPDAVAEWLAAADVFCLVSSREGCCNAVLEALACGRPVVATPVGDNAHFVRPGVNGSLVPVDDAEATGRALADALSNTRWDPERISRGLPVGGWTDVAGRVIRYFRERLAR